MLTDLLESSKAFGLCPMGIVVTLMLSADSLKNLQTVSIQICSGRTCM